MGAAERRVDDTPLRSILWQFAAVSRSSPLFAQRSLPMVRFVDGRWTAVEDGAEVAVAPSALDALTLNLWFGEVALEERARAACALIAEARPAFVALQEVTVKSLAILRDDPVVRERYWLSDARGSTFDTYGTVLLSLLPARALWLAELGGSMGRAMPWAEFSLGEERLAVGAVHLESGRHNSETRADQLRECFARLSACDSAILLGDCNFADGDRLEERVIEPGYLDAWTATRGASERGYTRDSERNAMFAAMRDGRVLRRIDRIYSRSARWKATGSRLVATEPIARGVYVSDHFGVWALFE